MFPPVVTRFAPSPTGFLHIGGARTALFNWLFARRHGGAMHLRIEDTDRERSTQAAIEAILDGLRWLGITWDGEVVYQFARAERHREVAEQLLAQDKAYRCYATQAELDEMRTQARARGSGRVYDGRWRDRDPREAPAGLAPTVRLRAPLDGETVVEDVVQGRVTWRNADLDDFVLLRSDGTPTYMLSVVVDDHDMGITHVVRGDDHLTNAARQTLIYQALGWDVPVMAHIPLIHGPDGSKLSKRHGALGIDAYRAMGYLPAALRNYLLRLGWGHGDQEIFSLQEMTEAFDLEGIGRSPARLDFARLDSLDGHYIRTMPDGDLLAATEAALPHLTDGAGAALAAKLQDPEEGHAMRARLLAALPGLKERAKKLVDICEGAAFLVADRPLALDAKASELLANGGRGHLQALLPRLAEVAPWEAPRLEAAVRAYAETAGTKLGQVAQPLRAALTGRAVSPGIFDVLTVLGREESLGRLSDQASAAA